MPEKIRKQLARLNQQDKEFDAIYHAAAVRFGLSDCAFWILYVIYESEQEYTQNDLVEEWFFPKQTINSAISNLVKDGLVRLEVVPGTRNRKSIRLTADGKSFCEKHISAVIEAEQKAFGRLTSDERRTLLALTEKNLVFLKEEIENL